jgi:hypothetical protein
MIQDYLSLPDPEAAAIISSRVSQWDKEEPLRYAAIGLMCLAVEKRELWRYMHDPDDGLPCRSFARWVRVHAPGSYSTCYAAKADVEALSDVPAEDLAQIPQGNFHTMKQLSTQIRKLPATIAAAKTKRPEEFVEHVRQQHPNQALEHKRMLRFSLDESAAVKVNEVIDMALEQGCSGRSEALEMMAEAARDQWEMLGASIS